MKTIEFTSQQKYIIGEFVFSHSVGVLIKSDCEKLVVVLFEKELINEATKLELFDEITKDGEGIDRRLLAILESKVAVEQRKEIMKNYYK